MSQSTHRIRRQTWLVRASSQADAMRARTAVNEAWLSASDGEFERACDEAAPAGVVLRIPRLELRVQVANSGELSTSLPKLVSAQLAEQLQEIRRHISAGIATEAAAAVITTSDSDAIATLLHYLRSGSLPWPTSGRTTGEALDLLRSAAFTDLARTVATLGTTSGEQAWYRLLQLADGNRAELLAALRSNLPNAWSVLVESLIMRQDSRASVRRHEELLVVASAIHASRNGGSETLASRIHEIAHSSQNESGLRSWISGLQESTDGELYQALASSLQSLNNGATQIASSAKTNRRSVVEVAEPESPTSANSERVHESPLAVTRESVGNAGLVLVHPFLTAILSRVGVSVSGEIPTENLPRAAALLHHVATGRTDIYEFELPLIKVLLGLTPDTALNVADGLLTAQDIEESDAVVAAMIGHWTAIGNTSVAGVRSTFLARTGLLALEDHGWTLHVETSSIDMLLNKLPWSFSIVRLPWMQTTLYTQWTH